VIDIHVSVGQPSYIHRNHLVIWIIDTWFHGVGFPQYAAAEFKEYSKGHHITPLVSSACFPKSNGLAESAVKWAKYLLLKSDSYMDFENRLYEMQNIPSSGTHCRPLKSFFQT
jgi:hypothetical protein